MFDIKIYIPRMRIGSCFPYIFHFFFMKKIAFFGFCALMFSAFLTGCISQETQPSNMAEAYHILLGYKGAPSASQEVPYETKQDALAQAQDILKELEEDASVKNFQRLAQKYSTGPSAVDGGYLKTFGRGRMVPQFDTAVFSMDEPGLYPEVVETKFGYHLIFVSRLWHDKNAAQ